MSKINIKSVEARNFLSYKELGYSLENKGMVMIEGVNSDSKEYSCSNGAGKSSIFDAIYWTLFEKWTRRSPYRVGKVVNDSVGKDCSALVNMEIDGSPYSVARFSKDTRLNNGLYLFSENTTTGKVHNLTQTNPATQSRIDQILGISWDVFFNAVMFGGGRFKSFIEAQDSDKKSMYEEMMGVGIFSKAREINKNYKKEVTDSVEELSVDINKLGETIARLKSDLISYKVNSDSFQKNIDAEVAEYTKAVEVSFEDDAKLHTSVNECKTKLSNGMYKQSDLIKENDTRRKELEIVVKNIESITADINETHKDIVRKETQLGALNNEILKFSNMGKFSVCPTCEREVSEGEFDDKLLEKGKEIDCIKSEIKIISGLSVRLQEALLKSNGEYKKISENISVVEREISSIATSNAVLDRDINNYNASISEVVKNIKYFKDKIDTTRSKENVWLSIISKTETELQEAISKHNAALSDVAKIQSILPMLEFWDEGFSPRGMESFLFETMLPQLNEKLREYTDILYAGSVSMEVLPTSKLKGGDLREKISFKVKGLNLETASDGELRRLDVAMLLANNYLLRKRVDVNILLLDQVFDVLDDIGCEKVVEVLHTTGIENIFVITHNQALKSMFSSSWKVIKSNGESKLYV